MKKSVLLLTMVLIVPSFALSATLDLIITVTPSDPSGVVVSQIHNAPGWLPEHIYAPASGPQMRVNSGPGWSSASSTYIPGQNLNAYELISGACVSGSTGPTGTGFSIQDGTCIWKFLSVTDYISITGWAFDNKPWVGGATYHYRDFVVSDIPLRAYAIDNVSFVACTSTVAPTGTGVNGIVATSDGCQWKYFADVIYTSKKSHIPTMTFNCYPYTFPDGTADPTCVFGHQANKNIDANYRAELWNDLEYQAGVNGENQPITTVMHQALTNGDSFGELEWYPRCSGPCFHIQITAAPGESFRDKRGLPLTGYDPTRGVAIHGAAVPYWWGQAFFYKENYVDLIDVQLKSDVAGATDGISAHGNNLLVLNSVLEGSGSDATVSVDTDSILANSLVISHGKIGVLSKYPMTILHSTIVNPDRTPGSIGIETYWPVQAIWPGTVVVNTGVFGFTHAAGHLAEMNGVPTSSFWVGDHNATDNSVTDSGSLVSAFGLTYTADPMPGSIYGVPSAGVFVNPAGDWRLSNNSPLRGIGSAFGPISENCYEFPPVCSQLEIYNFDSPDIVRTPRPSSSGFDIGAWQTP